MSESMPSNSQTLPSNVNNSEDRFITIPNVHGTALTVLRMGLATSALLTLLCTPGSKLIPTRNIGETPNAVYTGINKLSLFYLFADHAELGRVIGILLCSLSLLGFSSLGVFWVFFSLHNTVFTPDGGDQIGLIASIFCLLFGLSRWILNQRPESKVGVLLGFYTLFGFKLQIAFVYFNASLAKIRVDNWVNGTEVYYDVISPYFGLAGFRKELLLPLVDQPHILFFLTWGTMAVELFIGIAIFANNQWRALAILAVLLLHGGIAIFLGIISFSLTMITVATFALIPSHIIGKETSQIYEWFRDSLPRFRL